MTEQAQNRLSVTSAGTLINLIGEYIRLILKKRWVNTVCEGLTITHDTEKLHCGKKYDCIL